MTQSWYNSEGEFAVSLALISAFRSIDPDTKVGCALLGAEHQISLGFNTPKEGDTIFQSAEEIASFLSRNPAWLLNTNSHREAKRSQIAHAEEVAIFNWKHQFPEAQPSILATNVAPCNSCILRIREAFPELKTIFYIEDYKTKSSHQGTLEAKAYSAGLPFQVIPLQFAASKLSYLLQLGFQHLRGAEGIAN